MIGRRPVCTRKKIVEAYAEGFLKETPERVRELFAILTEKEWPGWRREIEAEMERQRAESKS